MEKIIKAIPIYNFLNYCNDSKLEKKVLDCGAGGKIPPLYIFWKSGYDVIGIDISDDKINKAKAFCEENSADINIINCDMKNLKFRNDEFSFIYSYNSIFHMKKTEIKKVISDMRRILKKDGLCYVNFLSKDDCRFGEGIKISDSEFLQDEDDDMIMHSYFDNNEAEIYFSGFNIIYKEKRIVEKFINNEKYLLSYIDYILKKI